MPSGIAGAGHLLDSGQRHAQRSARSVTGPVEQPLESRTAQAATHIRPAISFSLVRSSASSSNVWAMAKGGGARNGASGSPASAAATPARSTQIASSSSLRSSVDHVRVRFGRGRRSSASRGRARAGSPRSGRCRPRPRLPPSARAPPPPRSIRRARRSRPAPNSGPADIAAGAPTSTRPSCSASMITTGSTRGKCSAPQPVQSPAPAGAERRGRRAAHAAKADGGCAIR